MAIPDLESYAVQSIARAARQFGLLTPRKNPTGAYGHALSQLLAHARVFSAKSDEQWAAEVAFLKGAIKNSLASIEDLEARAILMRALEEHDGDA